MISEAQRQLLDEIKGFDLAKVSGISWAIRNAAMFWNSIDVTGLMGHSFNIY